MGALSHKLATLVGAQRDQFAALFDEVSPQSAQGGKVAFAFVALSATFEPLDDEAAYVAAFDAAESAGWLQDLVRRGVTSGLLPSQVIDELAAQIPEF